MFSELKRIIDQICRDKGIDRSLLVSAIEEAVLSAARKHYGNRRDLEVRYNDELGEVEVFQFQTVVDEVEDEENEISLEEAQDLDPEAQVGDDIGIKLDNIADLGRIAAQSAKQVIIQKMKEAESEVIYEMYRDREGEIVNGIVQRFERGNMIVNLGRTDAILPASQQMPRRSFRQGDRIRAYLLEVRNSSREPQLVLSRTDDRFLAALFALEVPEIAEGVVKIMGVAREPGYRAKIAVNSIDSDVDPVGACVGMKGSRVQNVVQELQGEKIDIVPWSPDPAKFVTNALSPAQISMVVVDEENKTLLVVTPDDQLSLAIGRQGQNVRLASSLLGWKIDVKSESRYALYDDPEFLTLLEVEGMEERMAERLHEHGITSAAVLAAADAAAVAEALNLEEEAARALVAAAAAVPAGEDAGAGETEETEDDAAAEADGADDAGAVAADAAEADDAAAADADAPAGEDGGAGEEAPAEDAGDEQ